MECTILREMSRNAKAAQIGRLLEKVTLICRNQRIFYIQRRIPGNAHL